jgi:hypothetical protein
LDKCFGAWSFWVGCFGAESIFSIGVFGFGVVDGLAGGLKLVCFLGGRTDPGREVKGTSLFY